MIVHSCITVLGVRIVVTRWRYPGGFSAELRFEDGDRAIVDAASAGALDELIEAVAYPAVVARRASREACECGCACRSEASRTSRARGDAAVLLSIARLAK
jgi:hypothetical protein